MKSLFFITLALVTAASCRKNGQPVDNNVNLLAGAWKMVAVENVVTGSIITKDPGDVNPYCNGPVCDVVIEFEKSGGNFTMNGHTITNDLAGNVQVGSNNTISMQVGYITKLGDAQWSGYLTHNITAFNFFEATPLTLRLYFDNGSRRLVFDRD